MNDQSDEEIIQAVESFTKFNVKNIVGVTSDSSLKSRLAKEYL